MSRRRVRVLALSAALTMVATATACGDDGGGGVFLGMPEEVDSAEGEPGTPTTPEETAQAAIQEVERYWESTYPELYGSELTPLAGGYHPYDAANPPPDCGPYPISYEEVAANAYYCPPGDYVAWDQDLLLSWLWDEFDGFTIGIVMAHEFAHAVQERINELEVGNSVRVEMQADCFAGAWTGWIAAGNSEHFDVHIDQLDNAIAGMIAIRDLPGMHPDDPGAHGSGFDRVRAFQDGFEDGPEACAEYPDLDRRGEFIVTQIPFDPTEYETGGDLHLEDRGPDAPGLLQLTEEYLEIFYERLFREQLGIEWRPVEGLLVVDPAQDEVTCGSDTLSGSDLEWITAYCADENFAVIDGAIMAPRLFESIGDFAVAAEIAQLWALAAQDQLGIDPSRDASLQADCLTGYFAGALFPVGHDELTALGSHPERDIYLRLSAGDLDEALQGILAYDTARRNEHGTVFERSAAMSTGVLDGIAGFEGISGCSQYHEF